MFKCQTIEALLFGIISLIFVNPVPFCVHHDGELHRCSRPFSLKCVKHVLRPRKGEEAQSCLGRFRIVQTPYCLLVVLASYPTEA